MCSSSNGLHPIITSFAVRRNETIDKLLEIPLPFVKHEEQSVQNMTVTREKFNNRTRQAISKELLTTRRNLLKAAVIGISGVTTPLLLPTPIRSFRI